MPYPLTSLPPVRCLFRPPSASILDVCATSSSNLCGGYVFQAFAYELRFCGLILETCLLWPIFQGSPPGGVQDPCLWTSRCRLAPIQPPPGLDLCCSISRSSLERVHRMGLGDLYVVGDTEATRLKIILAINCGLYFIILLSPIFPLNVIDLPVSSHIEDTESS